MILPPGSNSYRPLARPPHGREPNLRRNVRGLGLSTMLVLLAVVLSATGCGRKGPPPRKMVPVSGTIMLDGRPLPDGFISLVSPTKGDFETFPIREGKFKGKAGLGVRTVEIIAIRDAQPQPVRGGAVQGPPAATRTNYLPAKYSTASTLRADVTEGGPNVFTFDLQR